MKRYLKRVMGLACRRTLPVLALPLITGLPATGLASMDSYRLAAVQLHAGQSLSTGGIFQLSGKAGEPAPGGFALKGGTFSLSAGTATPVSIESSGPPPRLSIALVQGNQASLSWPLEATGYRLQYTSDLGSGVWVDEPAAVLDTSEAHTVTVPCAGNRFYRLKR